MAEVIETILDIETSPLPDGELERLAPPFTPLSVNGSDIINTPFDESDVKLGRMKDPDKITVKIEAAREKYAADVKAMVEKVEQARIEHWLKIKSKAALKALFGKVLAIGFLGPEDGLKGILSGDEPAILLKIGEIFQEQINRGNRIIGFGIFRFDLPFLVRRSWILGLNFPFNLVWLRSSPASKGWWNPAFVDLMEHWRLGVYQEYVSLDTMAKALGVGSKSSEVTGATFHKYWQGNSEERQKARAYLVNDVQVTRACAARLGCLIERES